MGQGWERGGHNERSEMRTGSDGDGDRRRMEMEIGMEMRTGMRMGVDGDDIVLGTGRG